MDLADIIRMNQLVRHRTNVPGFEAWFSSLDSDGQRTLLLHLYQFANQAGADSSTYESAIRLAGLRPDSHVVKSIQREEPWLISETIADLHGFSPQECLFLLVHLFGVAEQRVYAKESVLWCNHWWHRDLTDQWVVDDILSDPKFVYTSMKTDLLRFVKPGWWFRLLTKPADRAG